MEELLDDEVLDIKERSVKERHVYVTIVLYFLIISNAIAITGEFYRFFNNSNNHLFELLFNSTSYLIGIGFLVLILKFDKRGFWYFFLLFLGLALYNLYLGNIITDIIINAVIFMPFLFSILLIRKNNKSAWSLLE